jgi:hypothetical protein
MRTRRGRCSIFAVHPASGQQPRLARAARRAQGPRSGHFGKLDPTSGDPLTAHEDRPPPTCSPPRPTPAIARSNAQTARQPLRRASPTRPSPLCRCVDRPYPVCDMRRRAGLMVRLNVLALLSIAPGVIFAACHDIAGGDITSNVNAGRVISDTQAFDWDNCPGCAVATWDLPASSVQTTIDLKIRLGLMCGHGTRPLDLYVNDVYVRRISWTCALNPVHMVSPGTDGWLPSCA